MNEIQTVEFREEDSVQPTKQFPVYPVLFGIQIICLGVVYAAAKGWLN